MSKENEQTTKEINYYGCFEKINGRLIITEKGKKMVISFISFILVLVIGLVSFFSIYGKTKDVLNVNFTANSSKEGKNWDTSSKIVIKHNYAYGIYYPDTKDSVLDKEIENQNKTMIDDFLSKYKREKVDSNGNGSILYSDYEGKVYGQYAQIVRDISCVSPKKSYDKVVTLFYDTKNNKVFKGSDFFDSTFKQYISALVNNYFTTNYKDSLSTEVIENLTDISNLNIDNFSIDKDYLYLYLDYEDNTYSFKIETNAETVAHLRIEFDNVEKADKLEKMAESYAHYKDYIQEGDFGKAITMNINPDQPMIAFTFDDGPNATYTEDILDILAQYDCVATFFPSGKSIEFNEAIITRAFDMGCEIGNKTINNTYLTDANSKDQFDEMVDEVNSRIKKLTGFAPTLLRPPGGLLSEKIVSYSDYPLVTWSVDTGDSNDLSKDDIVNVIKNLAESEDADLDGEIILMHDTSSKSVDAFKEIVPYLINRGYQLVTVSDLLQLKKIEIKKGSVYRTATDDYDIIKEYSYGGSKYKVSGEETIEEDPSSIYGDNSSEETTAYQYSY